MKTFIFEVVVHAETVEEAKQVMRERIDHDEWYGFDYHVAWWATDNSRTDGTASATV